MPYQSRLSSLLRLSTATSRLSALLIVIVCLMFPVAFPLVFSKSASAQHPQNFRPGSGLNAIKNFGRSVQSRVGFNSGAIETQNFVVYAADEQMARKVSREAERFRKELAIQWLGHELPTWRHKCPIKVKIANNAGGETSFAFITNNSGPGQPIDWNMKIYGPPDRVLDAVLPHEITHTIFATHFGRPLPRWADEGACTTVEHEIERKKNHRMLLEFLTSQPSRGIPFNRMFTMRNYPHDILPLYAQGYSVARFLIAKGGRRHFVDYVGRGLENEGRVHVLRAWDQATQEFYQYKDLSELQLDWLAWVKSGSDDSQLKQSPKRSGQLAKSNSAPLKSVYQRSPIQDPDVVAASFVELGDGSGSDSSVSSTGSGSNNGWSGRADTAQDSDGQAQTAELAGASKVASLAQESPVFRAVAGSDDSPKDSWYIREMNRNNDESQPKKSPPYSSAYNSRVASKPDPITSRLRKVPSGTDSPTPSEHDSRLPKSWNSPPATLWR